MGPKVVSHSQGHPCICVNAVPIGSVKQSVQINVQSVHSMDMPFGIKCSHVYNCGSCCAMFSVISLLGFREDVTFCTVIV